MDKIITITEERTVNISELEKERDSFLAMADEVHFVSIDESLSEEIKEVLNEKNSDLELIKADMVEQARLIDAEIKKYG